MLCYIITSSSLSLTLSQNISTLDNIGTTLTQLKSVTTLLQQCNKIVTARECDIIITILLQNCHKLKKNPPAVLTSSYVLWVHFWEKIEKPS